MTRVTFAQNRLSILEKWFLKGKNVFVAYLFIARYIFKQGLHKTTTFSTDPQEWQNDNRTTPVLQNQNRWHQSDFLIPQELYS